MVIDSILVRQFLESRLMVGHRPLKSADVGSSPTFPTTLVTGGLLVSQSRFEREPRRSDSYSVIHCKEGSPGPGGLRPEENTMTKKVTHIRQGAHKA
jgi:hypothetical protein